MSLFYRRHSGGWHGRDASPFEIHRSFFGVDTPPPVYQHSSPPLFCLKKCCLPFPAQSGCVECMPGIPAVWVVVRGSQAERDTRHHSVSVWGDSSRILSLHMLGVSTFTPRTFLLILPSYSTFTPRPSVLKPFGWRNISVLNWQGIVREKKSMQL